jgi:DNA polymerase-1
LIERKDKPIVDPNNCRRCRFGIDVQPNTRIVTGIGNPKASIMLVGEAPGKTEAHTGIPFSGDAGDTLTELLDRVNIKRESVYISNAVKCWPWAWEDDPRNPGVRRLTNTTPDPKEIKACQVYLKEEISIIKPKVIIALGGSALSALENGKKIKITERRGHPSIYQGSESPRIFVVPTLHPSYVLRNGGVYSEALKSPTMVAQDVIKDLELAVRISKDEIAYQPHHYLLVDNREKLEWVLSKIRERQVMSFDTETMSLAFGADILGIGFAWSVGEACYIPFLAQPEGLGDAVAEYWSDKDISREEVVSKIKDVLEDPEIQKAGHNSKYDTVVLQNKLGIDVHGLWWDSMCGAYIIDENGSHKLDDLKNKYIDLIGYKDKLDQETDSKKNMHKASLKTICEYCCGDCDATYRLTKDQIDLFETKPNYLWMMHNFYTPIMEFVKDFEYVGVKYNVPLAKSMHKDYGEKAEKLRKEAISLVGVDFDIDSNDDLAKVLFGVLGLTHSKRTKKTQASAVDSDVLEDLAEEHPVPKLILEYKHLTKMKSTYMERFIKEADIKGRLHIPVNPIGTVTGRPSSEGLMNVPREEEIKRLFIPETGCVLIQGDESQVEVRCFAHYSGEQFLIDAFAVEDTAKTPLDVHALIASKIKGEPYEEFYQKYKIEHIKEYEDIRQAAKSLVFGILYGMGIPSIAKRLGITIKEATAFSDSFFETLPTCKKWINETHRYVEQTGKVFNIFGRERRLPAIFSKDEETKSRARRQAVNSIIQATASDIVFLALIDVHRHLKENKVPANIVLTVYDSIVIEAPVDTIPHIRTLLKEKMEIKRHPDFKVKLRADLDTYGEQGWGSH